MAQPQEDFGYSIYGDKESSIDGDNKGFVDTSIKMSDQTPTKKGLTEKETQVINKIRLILTNAGFEKENKESILLSYTPKTKSEDVDLRALQNAVNAEYKQKKNSFTSMGAPNVFEINSQIEKDNETNRPSLVEEHNLLHQQKQQQLLSQEKLLQQQRLSQGGRTSKRQRKNRSSRRSSRRRMIRRTRRRV